MYGYVGLSLASGLPWETFQDNDETDPRINATYAAILRARNKRKGSASGRSGPQMSG